MTAADHREELEAAIWRVPAKRHATPLHTLVTEALAAADAYAEAVADERSASFTAGGAS